MWSKSSFASRLIHGKNIVITNYNFSNPGINCRYDKNYNDVVRETINKKKTNKKNDKI